MTTTDTRYLTQDEYKRQKTALRRAISSRDPVKVLVACERVLEQWQDKVWPDDWSLWAVHLYDAWLKYERTDDPQKRVLNRFRNAYDRLG